MEGVQPAKLSEEARNGFSAAVASMPAEGSETPVETEAAPASGTSPAPNVPESTGETVATEETVATQPETGDEPSAEAEAKGPIPYERFKEVNERKKQLEEQLRAAQTRGADPAVIEQMAQAQTRAYLAEIAARHPELQKAIMGDPEQPSAPQVALDPKDPVHAKIIALETAQRSQNAALQNMTRRQLIESMEDRAETRMESHPVFGDSDYRNIGETLIAQKLLANPKLPVESVVDDVAKQLRGLQEKTKASYVKAKVTTPAKIAPGVGGGSAAPSGTEIGQKFAFGGSARKALEAAIRAEKTA